MRGRRRYAARRVAVALVALAGGLASAGPDRDEVARQRFAARHRAILFEAGTERAKLGTWCRDAGLVAQATATFLRAVEESEGQNTWAVRIVDLMRKLDDKFWRAVNPHPSKAYLDTFERKSNALDEKRGEALFKLAKDGWKGGLEDEALGVWRDLARDTERPLRFDAKEQLELPAGAVPPEPSAKLKAAAITVNGQLYLRDAFLDLIPQVKEVREATGTRVRVRIQGAAQAPDDLLASLEALLPSLEEDLGGRPTRRMNVFVFQDRATFGTWLGAAKLGSFAVASGLADGATNTALVCAEGVPPETLRGLCMHELSHLFMYGVTPVVMPSWYAEGFAETWGGEGTFTWAGGKLVAGGPLPAASLAALGGEAGLLPLEDLLAGDALGLLAKDKARGRTFYAQSWAFLRFLRTGASPDVQARFRLWETACRGAAFGAQAGKPREQDTGPASADFRRRFGAEVPALEKAFRAWMASR